MTGHDDGQISNTISFADLTFGQADLKSLDHLCCTMVVELTTINMLSWAWNVVSLIIVFIHYMC